MLDDFPCSPQFAKGLRVYLTIPCSLLDRYLSKWLELFNFWQDRFDGVIVEIAFHDGYVGLLGTDQLFCAGGQGYIG